MFFFFFFKTCSLGRDTRRSDCSTCTARTGNARVASVLIARCSRRAPPGGAEPPSQLAKCGIPPEFLEEAAASLLLLLLLLQLHLQRERLKVCVIPSPCAERSTYRSGRWKSRLSPLLSVCVVEASLFACLSVCCCTCSGYVDASFFRLLQPLGLLL